MKSSALIAAIVVTTGLLTPSASAAGILNINLPILGLGGSPPPAPSKQPAPSPSSTPTPTPSSTATSTPSPPSTPTPTPTGTSSSLDTSLNDPVDLVRLQVQVTTTSNWSGFTISQGYFASSRVMSQTGDGTWQLQTSAVAFGNGDLLGGTKSYTADVLYADTEPSQPFTLTLTKGQLGSATATIHNLDTNAVIATIADNDRTATTQTHPVSTQLTRSAFMGTSHSVLPRADNRKLVLSFYYPWYTDYQNPGVAETPGDPRSTYDQAGVDSMTAQAKANGIDGFIVSWAGADHDGTQFGEAVNSADNQGQKITGYIESVMSGSGYQAPSEARELSWIVQLLQYSNHPSFLKTAAGVPIVFVYQMASLTPANWADILSLLQTTYGEKVALVGDATDPSYLPYEWGVHYYPATASESDLAGWSMSDALRLKAHAALYGGTSPLFAAAVSPGFNDQALRGNSDPVVPRDGGERYVQTWDAALAGEPDWVLVTSWNEWYEHTAVEPGTISGGQALATTQADSAAWKAQN